MQGVINAAYAQGVLDWVVVPGYLEVKGPADAAVQMD
jgi:hypothetical protein